MSITQVQLFSFPVSEVQEAPWGRFVTLDDPDGNGIVLQATAPPPA